MRVPARDGLVGHALEALSLVGEPAQDGRLLADLAQEQRADDRQPGSRERRS